MKRLTSRVLYQASPIMLAVALGLLGPAALNDDEEEAVQLADDADGETVVPEVEGE